MLQIKKDVQIVNQMKIDSGKEKWKDVDPREQGER